MTALSNRNTASRARDAGFAAILATTLGIGYIPHAQAIPVTETAYTEAVVINFGDQKVDADLSGIFTETQDWQVIGTGKDSDGNGANLSEVPATKI
jgi:hypothetical protein